MDEKDYSEALTPEARLAIRAYLVQLVGIAAGAVGALNVLGLVFVVPRLAAQEVTRSAAVATAQLDVARVQSESLVGAGTVKEQLRTTQADLDRLARQLADVDRQIAALSKVDALKLSAQIQALSDLGDSSQAILARIDALRQEIPTKVKVTRTNSLNFANRNRADNFCSDQDQVMVAGALGTTNLDFAPFCGSISLTR